MADEFRTFAVTVAAGTPIATPVETVLAMPFDRMVDRVQFRVPPGPLGNVGFALMAAHQQVVPFAKNTWIITNDEIVDWDFGSPLEDGDWSLLAYNTGAFPHTIQVRFLLRLALPATPVATPISAMALSGTV